VFTEIYGANRRDRAENVPNSVVLPTPQSMAAGLRLAALVVSGEAGRAAVAVEGRWDGSMDDPDFGKRAFQVHMRQEGGRIAGTLTTWRGSVELRSPLRDIGFDHGQVRFTADLQGAAFRFKGTLENNTVTGTIERARGPRSRSRCSSWSSGLARVVSGLERLIERPEPVRGLRVGLVCNPTSVTSELVHAKQALGARRGVKLQALFGPEHGIAADAQDLVEVGHSRDCATGLPVQSLYGETRVPTKAMLEDVDAMVYDIQDVGSRYYTFVYTMLHVMEACARDRKRVVVLDRPNPLGGEVVDGNLLQLEYLSFVGMHPLWCGTA
jgi:hypothetical protein